MASRAGTIEVVLTGTMRGLKRALGKAESRTRRAARTIGRWAARIGAALSVAAVAGATAATKAFTSFESALVGVSKTVDAPMSKLRGLADQFRAMSTRIPVATNELLRIAQLGGQMGVATRNLDEFARTVAALDVSTDLGAEEASLSLSRFLNVMGLGQDMIDNVGSVLVRLGNNFEAMESEIVQTQRFFASAARTAGFAADEVLGLSAAINAAGIRSESGGTAMIRVFDGISKAVSKAGPKLEKLARVAGLAPERFAQLWEQDASRAFVAMIEGFGRMVEGGEDVRGVINDLFGESVRTKNALLALAGSGDLVERSFGAAADEIERNTALTEEARKFYSTLTAELQRTRNAFVNVFAEIGEKLSPALRDMLGFLRDNADVMAGAFARGLAAAIGGIQSLLGWISRLVDAMNAVPSVSIGPGAELAEAEDALSDVEESLRRLRSSGEVTGDVRNLARGVLGGERVSQALGTRAPGIQLEMALMAARKELTKTIDEAGGLADKFEEWQKFTEGFDQRLERLQRRLARTDFNFGGGGGGGDGGDEQKARNLFQLLGLPAPGQIVSTLRQQLSAKMEQFRSGGGPVLGGLPGRENLNIQGRTADEAARAFSQEFTGGGAGQGMENAGGQGGDDFIEGFGDRLKQGAQSAMQSLLEGLVKGQQDIGKALANIGLSLASSLLTGGLFAGLGIASPSSEARFAGRMVGEGLARGMEDMSARVSRAAGKLGTRALPGVSGSGASPSVQVAGAAAGIMSGLTVIDINDLSAPTRYQVARDVGVQRVESAKDTVGRQTGRLPPRGR